MLEREWRERAHDGLLKPVDYSCARVGNEPGFARLTGLETHGSSCRDIQPAAQGELSLKGEGRVALREMIMTSNLDRPVAGVGDLKGDGDAVIVEYDVTAGRNDFARNHRQLAIKKTPPSTVSAPITRSATFPTMFCARIPIPIPAE
jgi:hypothetical protein